MSAHTLTINVNGLNGTDGTNLHLENFLDAFNRSPYDGAFIQEPRYSRDKHDQDFNWEAACARRHITCLFSHNEAGSGGVATLWKQSFIDMHSHFSLTTVSAGQAQLTKITINGVVIAYCNIYASSSSSSKRKKLFNRLKDKLPFNTIVTGDFNQVQDVGRDVWQRPPVASRYPNGGWAECQAMMRHLGLVDGWREQEGQEKIFYTHIRKESGEPVCMTRLDMALTPLPDSLCPLCDIGLGFDEIFWQGRGQADHKGVTTKITFQPPEKIKLTPKINPHIFLLKEWLAVQSMLWGHCTNENSLGTSSDPWDIITFWNQWKEVLTSEALSFSKEYKDKYTTEDSRLKILMEWHSRLQFTNPLLEGLQALIDGVRLDLEKLTTKTSETKKKGSSHVDSQ